MTTSDAEVTTNLAAARIQIISEPMASPGSCGICGISEDETGFVTANLHFEFYGTLIFCSACAGNFARVLGWINPEDAVKLQERLTAIEQEAEILRASLLHLETAVDELTNYRLLRNANDSITDDGGTIPSQELTDSIADVVQLPGRVAQSESEISESVIEQGPDDLSNATSDESSGVNPVIGI